MSLPPFARLERFFIALALLSALPLLADSVDNISRMTGFRQSLTVPPLPTSDEEKRLFEEGLAILQARRFGTWPAPGSSIASPSGFGAEWTDFFAGMSVQSRPRFRSKANGTGFIGFGLGNARTLAALEISFGLHGLVPPGDKGALNLKLHRLLPGEVGVALGWDNVASWGGSDGKAALFLAASKSFHLRSSDRDPFSMLTLHAGIGNGSYRSEEAVFTEANTLGWFSSVGLRLFAPVTAIVNWSGQDLFAGFSVTPFRTTPLAFTIAAQDLTGHAGDGVRYLVSLAYSESLYRLLP